MEMKRSDFLKMCLAGLAGAFALRGLKILDSVDPKNLKEARFYRSADTLLG
jgi:hypothetical protein